MPLLATAEHVNIELRKQADEEARAILAELCMAMCDLLNLCLKSKQQKNSCGPNFPSAHSSYAGADEVTLGLACDTMGYRPTIATLFNLYYLSISLRRDPLAMHVRVPPRIIILLVAYRICITESGTTVFNCIA